LPTVVLDRIAVIRRKPAKLHDSVQMATSRCHRISACRL